MPSNRPRRPPDRSAPGFEFAGSAAEHVVIAARRCVDRQPGDRGGDHLRWSSRAHESPTRYRVAPNQTLACSFATVVDERDGDLERQGRITLIPGGLIYRSPDGETTFWRFALAQARYVETADALPLVLPEEPGAMAQPLGGESPGILAAQDPCAPDRPAAARAHRTGPS